MENNQISNMLTIVLVAMVAILVIMIIIYCVIVARDKKRQKEIENKNKPEENEKTGNSKETSIQTSSLGSVLDFMEFETVEDNMIIKKEEQNYAMVIECQGVNYDLMSEVEKAGVEEGFLQFLNTLRHPVQLYIQTRSINLEKSIEHYKDNLKEIENDYRRKKMQYDRALEDSRVSSETRKKLMYELTKSQNLYDYAKDIIQNIERLSLNKNILNKKYYVVISYYYDKQENAEAKYTKSEIRNLAFSDLYTKAQSIIRTLSSCSVSGRILDTVELINLLYMAYNREGAETYGVEKALKANYDKLYSTAPDVLDKKIKALDKEIEEKGIQKAQTVLDEVRLEKQKEIEKKEREKEKLINDIAKIILDNNKNYIGRDVAKESIEKIDEKKQATKKGGRKNA